MGQSVCSPEGTNLRDLSERGVLPRPEGMSKQRQFKFDRGDWVALRVRDDWKLIGKVRDADSESITVVDRNGVDQHFVPGEDPIVHAHWRSGGRWYVR